MRQTSTKKTVDLINLDPPNGLSENILVVAVVVAELKFSDIQRQVLARHLVEGAEHAALEALERIVRVEAQADDVRGSGMVDHPDLKAVRAMATFARAAIAKATP